MIRVVMFDLGGTLLNGQGQPFAGLVPALQAIMAMHAGNGKPLATCLVSDFTPVQPPLTAAKIKPVFEQYLAILAAAGLRDVFEPVAKRVTLSTHAGVAKPAQAVFSKALQRLGSSAPLTACLLITEDTDHVAAVRAKLGMRALLFRPPGAHGTPKADFDDWSQAPALVAHLIDPHRAANMLAAVQAHFAARGVQVEALYRGSRPDRWRARGQGWFPVDVPGQGELGRLHVALPVQLEVTRQANGTLQGAVPGADAEQLREAEAYVTSLATHGQIAGAGAARGATHGTTHAIETDAAGRRCLVRKRFSAV